MRCSVLSDTELACKTPEVNLHSSVFVTLLAETDNPVRLYVYLGEDVLNRSTKFRLPFRLYANPEIQEWEPRVKVFPIYKGETTIRITVR